MISSVNIQRLFVDGQFGTSAHNNLSDKFISQFCGNPYLWKLRANPLTSNLTCCYKGRRGKGGDDETDATDATTPTGGITVPELPTSFSVSRPFGPEPYSKEGHLMPDGVIDHVAFNPFGLDDSFIAQRFDEILDAVDAEFDLSNVLSNFRDQGIQLSAPQIRDLIVVQCYYYITTKFFFIICDMQKSASFGASHKAYASRVLRIVRNVSGRRALYQSSIDRMHIPPEILKLCDWLFDFKLVPEFKQQNLIYCLGIAFPMDKLQCDAGSDYRASKRFNSPFDYESYCREFRALMEVPKYYESPQAPTYERPLDLFSRGVEYLVELEIDSRFKTIDRPKIYPLNKDSRDVLLVPPVSDFGAAQMCRWLDCMSNFFIYDGDFLSYSAVMRQILPGWSLEKIGKLEFNTPAPADVTWIDVLRNVPVVSGDTQKSLPVGGVMTSQLNSSVSYELPVTAPLFLMISEGGTPGAVHALLSVRSQSSEDGKSFSVVFPGMIGREIDARSVHEGAVSFPRYVLDSSGACDRLLSLSLGMTLGFRFYTERGGDHRDLNIRQLGYFPFTLAVENFRDGADQILRFLIDYAGIVDASRFGIVERSKLDSSSNTPSAN
jgi:hypothetical protein